MASRDLREDRFVERNGPPRRDSFESPPHEADVEEREEDEDSTSKSENDTVGSGDITAIRVCKSPDADPKENACRIPSIRDESVARRRYVHAPRQKFVIVCRAMFNIQKEALIRCWK